MSELKIPVAAGAWEHLQENEADRAALLEAARSFRSFLNHWVFLDQDTKQNRNLGLALWPAQEMFVAELDEADWIFFLKARQLGETTIECAYDGWVMRFRDPNARVHVFSKREKEAQSLLGRVKYGLERLPWWMRLPVEKDTLSEYWLAGGEDDVRRGFAYPANNDTARGETCTHAHIDEWAFMGSPGSVWAAIEPSAAGTVHALTTGDGPSNWTSGFWRRCLSGDALARDGSPIKPCFIGALERPDRTEAWLRSKALGMDPQTFRSEYPMTWEDAISGGGEYTFGSGDLDACGLEFRGLRRAEPGHKYVKAWDVGRHKDAAVGVVLDVTDDVMDVVGYIRLRGATYPDIQQAMEETHWTWPGLTVVEKNAAGEAVLENLDIPEHQREGFSTTGQSKPRIISNLQISVQNWLVRWDPVACEQLDSEMRGYQIPDDNVVQDSVMALAIGIDSAALEHRRVGRAKKPIEV